MSACTFKFGINTVENLISISDKLAYPYTVSLDNNFARFRLICILKLHFSHSTHTGMLYIEVHGILINKTRYIINLRVPETAVRCNDRSPISNGGRTWMWPQYPCFDAICPASRTGPSPSVCGPLSLFWTNTITGSLRIKRRPFHQLTGLAIPHLFVGIDHIFTLIHTPSAVLGGNVKNNSCEKFLVTGSYIRGYLDVYYLLLDDKDHTRRLRREEIPQPVFSISIQSGSSRPSHTMT